MKFAFAILLSITTCVVLTDAFTTKTSALTTARRNGVARNPTSVAATPKMEVWSEKNIRFTLLAGIGLPILGIVTPPDNALAASVLPLAIAAVWIYIFIDLLKAAVPQEE